MNENNPLIHVSMQIILHAGEARNKVLKALEFANIYDFDKADDVMKEALASIQLAHVSQTKIIQNEMSGENYEACLLFTHAQDTLMTINSEITLSKEMIKMYRKISIVNGKEEENG